MRIKKFLGFTAVCTVMVFSAVLSVCASELKFDPTTLTAAKDREEMKSDEVEGFTIVGKVEKRRSKKGGVTHVDIDKNENGAITFTAEAGALISAEFSSTGGGNTSELALKSGENVLKTESATGDSDGKKVFEYTVESAGTYALYSPTNAKLKRGTRIYLVTVSDGGEAPVDPDKPDDPIDPPVTFVYGDANADGKLAADDASFVLQKVLNSAFKMPIEEKTDDLLKYIDVDGGGLSASDATQIMQKVLNKSFVMPIEKQS